MRRKLWPTAERTTLAASPARPLRTFGLQVADDGQLAHFRRKLPDGTAVRDYVYVEDLAAAHVLAVEALLNDHSVVGSLRDGFGLFGARGDRRNCGGDRPKGSLCGQTSACRRILRFLSQTLQRPVQPWASVQWLRRRRPSGRGKGSKNWRDQSAICALPP
jgi:hypothetical protein